MLAADVEWVRNDWGGNFVHGHVGFDKQGRPIIYKRFGSFIPSNVLSTVGLKAFMRYQARRARATMRYTMKQLGKVGRRDSGLSPSKPKPVLHPKVKKVAEQFFEKVRSADPVERINSVLSSTRREFKSSAHTVRAPPRNAAGAPARIPAALPAELRDDLQTKIRIAEPPLAVVRIPNSLAERTDPRTLPRPTHRSKPSAHPRLTRAGVTRRGRDISVYT